VAYFLTVREVLFFVRPPAGNHSWKKPDSISVSFSDIERPIRARRLRQTNCPHQSLEKTNPRQETRTCQETRRREKGFTGGLRGLGGKGMNVRLVLIHTAGCHACEARDLEIRTGITWRASERLALTLVGKNLSNDHQLEAGSLDQAEFSSLIKRSVYAKFTWQVRSQSK
jgi:hypothetical protein